MPEIEAYQNRDSFFLFLLGETCGVTCNFVVSSNTAGAVPLDYLASSAILVLVNVIINQLIIEN